VKKNIQLLVLVFLLAGCKGEEKGTQVGTFTANSDLFWEVIPKDAVAERIGVRFTFTEGPAWHPDGFLLFSDIPENTIYSLEVCRVSEAQ